MESKQPPHTKKTNEWMRYAGMGTQFLAALGLAAFLGLKADKWFKISPPLLVIILPLIMLIGMFYKIFKATSKTKSKDDE